MQGDPSLRENISFGPYDHLSRLWRGLSGDPEAEAQAQASTAMQPVVGPYLKDVVTGQVAQRGLEGMSPADIALAFAGGGLATKITRGSGPGAGWFPTTKPPYGMTESGVPSVSNVTPLEADQLVRQAIDAKANWNLLPGKGSRVEPTPYDLAIIRQRWERAVKDLFGGPGTIPY